MPEFKPCPFCGNEELELLTEKDFYAVQGRTGSAAVRLRCWSCSTEMWEHSREEHNYDKRVQMLAAKWNRRAGDDKAQD